MSKKHTALRGRDFIEGLGKLLGFDPSNVHTITITADVREVVRIEIEQYGDSRLLEYDWSKLTGGNDQQS
jgi:hypothetical protein